MNNFHRPSLSQSFFICEMHFSCCKKHNLKLKQNFFNAINIFLLHDERATSLTAWKYSRQREQSVERAWWIISQSMFMLNGNFPFLWLSHWGIFMCMCVYAVLVSWGYYLCLFTSQKGNDEKKRQELSIINSHFEIFFSNILHRLLASATRLWCPNALWARNNRKYNGEGHA